MVSVVIFFVLDLTMFYEGAYLTLILTSIRPSIYLSLIVKLGLYLFLEPTSTKQ